MLIKFYNPTNKTKATKTEQTTKSKKKLLEK